MMEPSQREHGIAVVLVPVTVVSLVALVIGAHGCWWEGFIVGVMMWLTSHIVLRCLNNREGDRV